MRLNGTQVSRFENHKSGRGGLDIGADSTYIGLQAHTGRVNFRNIRVAALATALAVPASAGTATR